MNTNTKENTVKMHAYAVYQLPSDHSSYRDLYFMEASEVEAISGDYDVVARIDARSLEEAFRIGNFVCEEDRSKIEIVGEMHSISVGDILHNLETGDTWVCAGHGWDKINMKECA